MLSEINPSTVPVRVVFEGDDPGFTVVEARASLALSTLYELDLIVQHTNHAFGSHEFLRRRCEVELPNEPGAPKIACVVRQMLQKSIEPTGVSRYQLRLVSPYWLMMLYRDHRIRTNTAIAALATTLIENYESLAAPAIALTREHPVRPWHVQYGEADGAFLFRALAERGVATYFDLSNKSEMVLVDDTRVHRKDRVVRLPYAAPGSMAVDRAHVSSFELEAEQVYASAKVRDYWFERPQFDAVATQVMPDEREDDLERNEFAPGIGPTEAELQATANDILTAEIAPSSVVRVRSSVFLWPGQRLQIEAGPRNEADTELLVVSATSHWTTAVRDPKSKVPVREHELVCIPSAHRFLPKRPPKPRIHGIQSARVYGDGEIDVDEHGRVAVVFPWDRGSFSIRIRVSQGWAGLGYGLVTMPRVGDEVLIAYLDGDPEQPVIVGRLHNGENLSPLDLPKDKTVSTWRTKSSPGGEGFNEIRLDDLAGEERFDVHAQRDMTVRVERDAELFVGRNTNVEVVGNQKASVSGSGNVGFKKDLDLSAEKIRIEARSLLKLSGPTVEFNADTRTDSVKGMLTVGAGKEQHTVGDWFQVTGPVFQVIASKGIVLISGGSVIRIEPGGITIESSGPVDIKGNPIKLNC